MNEAELDPTSFDSRLVNMAAPPLVVGLALAVNMSPLSFLMEGFHVWMHELGHATVAWLTGRRALPLPFGWTSVADERSMFVYLGVLFLLGLLLVAGWRERMAWPVILAAALAALQLEMTWFMPEHTQRMLEIFAGVGGEFLLSALMMAAFFVQFPEKFRWGACRYVVLFIAASCLINASTYWNRVHHGTEDIPWGSMINGEDDGGGDMNILRDEFGWTNHQIIGAYYRLGEGCLAGLLVIYGAFALRLDNVPDRALRLLRRGAPAP
jgi:hypothetical protein